VSGIQGVKRKQKGSGDCLCIRTKQQNLFLSVPLLVQHEQSNNKQQRRYLPDIHKYSMQVITARKNAKDARLGVSLERTSDGRILVIRVADKKGEEGIFADTGLQVGMELILVNDKPCQGDLATATKALRSAPLGVLRLHVIAPTSETTGTSSIPKTTKSTSNNENTEPSSRNDISSNSKDDRYKSNDKSNKELAQDRPTDEDIVDPGAIEVKYESPVRKSKRSSKQRQKSQSTLDKESQQAVSLRKSRSQIPMGPTHTVVVPHVGHLGIRLQDVDEGQGVQVGRIDSDSVLADTNVRVGMRLLAVNGTVCASVAQVAQVLRHPSDGLLTLVVQEMEAAATGTAAVVETPDDLSGRFSLYKNVRQSQQEQKGHKTTQQKTVVTSHHQQQSMLTATVHKPRRSTATGIRLKEAPDRQSVRIDRIADDSLFVGTVLEVGQTLVKVNGISTTAQTTVQEIATWIRDTKGILTLTVLSKSSSLSLPVEQLENTIASVVKDKKKLSKSKGGKTATTDSTKKESTKSLFGKEKQTQRKSDGTTRKEAPTRESKEKNVKE
jgi:hypothetical protein